MNSEMNMMVAREQMNEVRRRSERAHQIARVTAVTAVPSIELRLARAEEIKAVDRIAALDDAPRLGGQVLLAIIDGDAVAGLSLLDQQVVANPFVHTSDAVELLRRWAGERPARARRRLGRSLRPKFA